MESQWTQKYPEHEHNNNISLEQYQKSIALMNTDLHDIQEDIQKLAEQQNQIQVQTMQAQQLLQAQQIANILNQQYSSQQNITGLYHPIQQQQQQFGSTPQLAMKPPHHQYINEQGQYVNQKIYSRESSRIIDDQYATTPSQYLNQEKQKNIAKYVQDTNHYRDQFEPPQNQFFLHGDPQTPPQPPARRTWSQQQQQPQVPPKPQPEMSSWSQQAQQNKFETMTWKASSPSQQQRPPSQQSGFVLHQNGREQSEAQRLFPVVHVTQKPAQHNVHQQPDDMMAPQSISFIGDEDSNDVYDEADNFQAPRMSEMSFRKSGYNQADELEVSLGKLNITSGSRTYRIPSPTTRNHPGLAANSFQSMESQNDNEAENEKGFYISFDNDPQPKRPKPPLRTKRSPKKPAEDRYEPQEVVAKKSYDVQETFNKPAHSERLSSDYERSLRRSDPPKESQAIIIANDTQSTDPASVDEMERKKEKIMLLSLQRRQQQEEAKARKEIEVMQRRERDQEKDEERARKKEEQMSRRAQILEQHRLKKAVEEAEREGKTLDRHTAELLMKQQQQQQMLTPQPKMRAVKSQRPRPKTIHVETNSSQHDISGASTKGKGSSSNLTGKIGRPTDTTPALSKLSVPLTTFKFAPEFNFVFVSRHWLVQLEHDASRLLSRQSRLVVHER